MTEFLNWLELISENSLIKSLFFVLTFLNTVYLLYSRLIDKPKLKSKPVSKHGNHMIWTIFPETIKEDGRYIKTYAFIPYMQVYNIGKQPVELDEWTLFIKDKSGYKELDILPIPLAFQTLSDGSIIKYEMLGMNDNIGAIQPGSSMSGLSLYTLLYPLDSLNLEEKLIIKNKDNSINGKFKIKDVFGRTNVKVVTFKYQDYNEVQKIMPNLHKSIYKENK